MQRSKNLTEPVLRFFFRSRQKVSQHPKYPVKLKYVNYSTSNPAAVILLRNSGFVNRRKWPKSRSMGA